MATKTKPSAKDLLNSLTAGKKPTKAVATSNRPDMELDPLLLKAFERFAEAAALAEVVEARRDQEKETLSEGCFLMWTERLWSSKNRPANPELRVEKNGQADILGIYQVQERYTFNAPEISGDMDLADAVTATFVRFFVAAGMNAEEAKEKAETLVLNELTLSPKPIIDLDRLVNGHYEGDGKNRNWVEANAAEQAVASKLIQMIRARSPKELAEVGCFTDEEAASAVEYKAQMVVKKGFLQRVCTYVNSLEQLRMVFSVIKPVKYPQVKKFAASDTPDEKARRLAAVAVDVVGVGSGGN